MCAIKFENITEIENLLEQLMDINFCNDEGSTVLTCAIFVGNASIVKRLLARGAVVRAAENNPMQVAQLMGNKKIIRLLTFSASKRWGRQNSHKGEPRHLRKAWSCECRECTDSLVVDRMRYEHELSLCVLREAEEMRRANELQQRFAAQQLSALLATENKELPEETFKRVMRQ